MATGVAARVAAWAGRNRNLPGPFGGGRPPVTFGPGVPLLINVYLALGANLNADPSTWLWTNITGFVRYSDGITASSGRGDEAGTVTPATASLTLDNRDGRFSRKNPTGAYYGLLTRNTPILVTVNPGNGAYEPVTQFVNEWPARWDKTGVDHTVPISCAGILRRLGQGQSPLKSALYRAITASSPVAYWSFQDGEDATQAASGITGGTPATTTPASTLPTFAADADLPGSEALPDFVGESALTGPVSMADTGEWQVSAWVKATLPDGTTVGQGVVAEWHTNSDTHPRWNLIVSHDPSPLISATVYATDGTPISPVGEAIDAIDGEWHLIQVCATQTNPTTINVKLYVDGALAGSASGSTYTLGQIVDGSAHTAEPATNFDVDTFKVGHLAVHDTATVVDLYAAGLGYAGETASARIARLCAEEGVTIVVQDGDSATLGPQSLATFLDVLREAEKADQGVLYEHRFGLGYQPHAGRYNAPTALALDYTNGDLGEVPEPADDDQRLRNSWTITRTGGSSATYTDDDSVATEGLYDDSDTVNVETDAQTRFIAEWLVAIGVNDDLRWPSIDLNLANAAGRELVEAWTQLPYGARITVANPPDQVTSDPIDAFVEGRTETFDQFLWTVNLNTTPAGVFEVLELETGAGNRGRLDLTQTLAAGIDSDDVTLSAATPGTDPLLTTTATFPADFPYDISIGGERMTVTATSGGTSPQTVTVTRSVNGVTKSHDAGAALTLWIPGVLAL